MAAATVGCAQSVPAVAASAPAAGHAKVALQQQQHRVNQRHEQARKQRRGQQGGRGLKHWSWRCVAGERRRKSVRGCIVSPDLSVLNLVIVKKGEQELPGLTDEEKPRMRGPKRASKIRKLFNLSKVSLQHIQTHADTRPPVCRGGAEICRDMHCVACIGARCWTVQAAVGPGMGVSISHSRQQGAERRSSRCDRGGGRSGPCCCLAWVALAAADSVFSDSSTRCTERSRLL